MFCTFAARYFSSMSSSSDSWLEERRGCHRIVGAYLYESWGQVLPDRSWRQAWNSLEFTASRTLVEFLLQNHDSQAREKELFSLLALFRSTYLVLTFASTSKPFSSLQGLRASAGREQHSCDGVWRIARRNFSPQNANDLLETRLGSCFRCVDSMASGNCDRYLQNRASTMD